MERGMPSRQGGGIPGLQSRSPNGLTQSMYPRMSGEGGKLIRVPNVGTMLALERLFLLHLDMHFCV